MYGLSLILRRLRVKSTFSGGAASTPDHKMLCPHLGGGKIGKMPRAASWASRCGWVYKRSFRGFWANLPPCRQNANARTLSLMLAFTVGALTQCAFLRQHFGGKTMLSLERPSSTARWPLVRVPAGSKVELTLLSGDMVRLVTHFYRSTFLCPEVEECHACTLLPARAYWYLPCIVTATRASSLLELSAHAAADLEQRCRFVGSAVRAGTQVEISRKSAKAPIRSEIIGQIEKPSLAQAHEWLTPLMAIFGLPFVKPAETLEHYGARVCPFVIERANFKASQLKVAADGRPQGRR